MLRTYQIKMATRVMNCEDSGELEDGTVYDRRLTIRETTEMQGFRTVTREVIEDRVEIDGEFCVVHVVLVDGEDVEENIEDHVNDSNSSEFERKWEEINRRWTRSLEDHVLGVSADHRGEDNSSARRIFLMITYLVMTLLMRIMMMMISAPTSYHDDQIK